MGTRQIGINLSRIAYILRKVFFAKTNQKIFLKMGGNCLLKTNVVNTKNF